MSEQKAERILGYDLARALAIIGMVIVNFKVVMGAGKAGPSWLVSLAGLLDGRAAATFVVLAGVGISLMSKKARLSGEQELIGKNRSSLFKRAAFLFVVGLLYSPIWPADILHFYGIYIAVGALVITASSRRLWWLAILFTIVFVIFILFFDYETGWNWETLEYHGFWTVAGMIRRLFFNGFHPVFPWTAFMLVGMWLGRQNLQEAQTRNKILLFAFVTVVIAEVVSWFLRTSVPEQLGLDRETIDALFGTEPMPPMPLYLLAGGGTAFVVICICVILAEKFYESKWLGALVSTGQLALTHYVAHVILGIGLLETTGRLENQTLPFALTAALIFSASAILFSIFWKKRYKRGPLEWLMRKTTG